MIGRETLERSREHREIWDLLPWLANQRLTDAQAERAERHLQQCDACRAELHIQQQLREAVRAEDAVVLAPQTSFNKLMQRIDAAEAANVEEETKMAPAARKHVGGMPRWLAIAASIQVVTVAALLGSLWWQQREVQTAPRYATLTAPAPIAKGPVLRVVFDEQTKLIDIHELLKEIDARVVAGPTDSGVFTLALNDKASSIDTLNSAASRLRQDAHVVFCEPAVMESEHQ
jgi:hypothetical protein